MPPKDGYSKEIEREADRAIRQLVELEQDLTDEIAAICARLDTKDGELVQGQKRNAMRARAQVVEALRKLGVRPVSLVLQESAEATSSTIAAKVAKDLSSEVDGFSFDVDASRQIGQVIGGYTSEVAAVFGDVGRAIVREINASLAGGVDVDRLIARASERARVSMSQARTLIDTAVTSAARQAIVDVASQVNEADSADGEQIVYRYVGPNDDLTRPFCDEHLGRYLSQEYVDKTTNDDGKPMSSTGGGYNCRHSLAPVMRALVPSGTRIL